MGPFFWRLVPHAGFEPAISALRGRCPGPLDEGGGNAPVLDIPTCQARASETGCKARWEWHADEAQLLASDRLSQARMLFDTPCGFCPASGRLSHLSSTRLSEAPQPLRQVTSAISVRGMNRQRKCETINAPSCRRTMRVSQTLSSHSPPKMANAPTASARYRSETKPAKNARPTR